MRVHCESRCCFRRGRWNRLEMIAIGCIRSYNSRGSCSMRAAKHNATTCVDYQGRKHQPVPSQQIGCQSSDAIQIASLDGFPAKHQMNGNFHSTSSSFGLKLGCLGHIRDCMHHEGQVARSYTHSNCSDPVAHHTSSLHACQAGPVQISSIVEQHRTAHQSF